MVKVDKIRTYVNFLPLCMHVYVCIWIPFTPVHACACMHMHVCILWYLQWKAYICIFLVSIKVYLFLKFHYSIVKNGINSAGKAFTWLDVTFRRGCQKQQTIANKNICVCLPQQKNVVLIQLKIFLHCKCSVISRGFFSLNGSYQELR